MKAECYLVISKRGNRVSVVRSTQRKPNLAGNEACVRLRLELPDDAFEAPLVTLPVEKKQLTVAVEADAA